MSNTDENVWGGNMIYSKVRTKLSSSQRIGSLKGLVLGASGGTHYFYWVDHLWMLNVSNVLSIVYNWLLPRMQAYAFIENLYYMIKNKHFWSMILRNLLNLQSKLFFLLMLLDYFHPWILVRHIGYLNLGIETMSVKLWHVIAHWAHRVYSQWPIQSRL